MPDELTSTVVDVALEAFWGDPAKLAPVQRRRYEFEKKLRLDLAAKGEEPADWLIEEIRSGEWARRQQRNSLNMVRNRARLARWKREGYWFDLEHRLRAPLICAHDSARRPATTSQQRPQRRTVARTAGSRGDPHESGDDDEISRTWRGLEAASVRMFGHIQRRNAAMRLA